MTSRSLGGDETGGGTRSARQAVTLYPDPVAILGLRGDRSPHPVPPIATATSPARLATGADLRRTGPEEGLPVVCLNGGTAAEVEGDWSASLGWLVRRLAPEHPDLAFYEVRYRVKSWNRLDSCAADARAALEQVARPDRPTVLLGYSMGGAVAIAAADHPSVTTVIGCAPWIPDRLDLGGLFGRHVAVLHGSLDAYLPGLPGVSASSSARGVERIRAMGVDATYELIPGAIHAMALRTPLGLVPAPRAATWARLVGEELARAQAESD